MQKDGNHNGKKKTRKELRDDRTKMNKPKLTTLDVCYLFGKWLIVALIEWFKPS